ncbi:MAG: adenylate kinase [Nitrososphaeraceae archaeon]
MAENSNNNNNSYGSNNNNNNSSNSSSTVKGSNADITSITNEASNDNNNNNNTININNNNNNTCSTKRVIIGGIPGVGKTSVISLAVKSLKEKGQNAKVVVFGTEMFEEAKRTAGVKNRDELRKLSLKDQRRLQDTTAKRIAELRDNIVIVDTHIFVRTGGGNYYPGLPMRLLDIIKPTSFIMIIADAIEIVNRRKNDTSRARDAISTQQIQYEIDISKLMVATCSILTGAPFIIIANNDTKMDDAVSSVARVLSAD